MNVGFMQMTAAEDMGTKTPPSIRVGEAGQYSREGEKCNLLLAICGERGTVQQPSRRWRNIWLEGGTTVERMIAFVQEILNSLGPGVPGRRYCITMDNLAAHKNLALQAMIVAAGHRYAYRAPYYAIDGPIEYGFNTIQTMLKPNAFLITDTVSLINQIGNAIQAMIDFEPYFRHCGFWR